MGAPTVYKWTDTGAPVLNSTPGSFINVLRACLVDGYEGKPAAGWSMPFDDGNEAGSIIQASFRNNPVTGTGFYLNVIDGTTSAQLYGYESMSSHNAGSNPFNTSVMYFLKSSISDVNEKAWVLIADDRFFYLFNDAGHLANVGWVDTSTGQLAMYFGDAITLFPDDAFFCVLSGGNSASTTYTRYSLAENINPSSATDPYHYVARNINGDVAITQWMLHFTGGPCLYNGSYGPAGTGIARTEGSEILTRPYVNNSEGYTMRGYLPGLWTVCNQPSDFLLIDEFTVDGRDFISFRLNGANSSGPNCKAIDLSVNFRP